MRKCLLLLLFIGLLLPAQTVAEEINLTPTPMQITMSTGKLALPSSFTIATGSLDEKESYEAQKFANDLTAVTGFSVNVKKESSDALIKMSQYNGNEELGAEGYTLNITDKIEISANEAAGFYFAFQTVKKLLPACVMAGVKDESVTEFALPKLSIVDAPRFEYRGFMLDVSRHYFDTKEIKRMLDVMSYYKMNRFHWHLVDDQGWRIEIDKYPKLTTIGATRSNSWNVDHVYGGYYTNEPYGPYFYTKEEAKEIVAYARSVTLRLFPRLSSPDTPALLLQHIPNSAAPPTAATA